MKNCQKNLKKTKQGTLIGVICMNKIKKIKKNKKTRNTNPQKQKNQVIK